MPEAEERVSLFIGMQALANAGDSIKQEPVNRKQQREQRRKK